MRKSIYSGLFAPGIESLLQFSPKRLFRAGMAFLAIFILGGLLLYTRQGQSAYTRFLPVDDKLASQEFNARIKTHFAMGSSEDAMKKILGKQGFEIEPPVHGTRIADYSRHMHHCDVTWTILWEANAQGQIFNISADQSSDCS